MTPMAKQPVMLTSIVPSGNVAMREEITPFKPYRASVPSAPPRASIKIRNMPAVCLKRLTNSKKKGMGVTMKRASLLWLLATAAATAAPKIELDRTVYDFGTTSLVDGVTGKFIYRNAGDEMLKIQPPKPSCGCTVAKLTADNLKPGESGELAFTIGLGYHTQRLSKEIYVSSNDPQQPTVSLGVKVEVKQTFAAQPPSVNFGSLPLGQSTNATVQITRLDGQKVVLTKLESTSDLITATIEPEGQIRIVLKAAGRPRRISEEVKLYSPDSKGAAFGVFVTARLMGEIELSPEALGWGMPDPEHWNAEDPDFILERTITVTATQPDRPLEIRNLSSTMKELKLQLETLEKDKQFLITASLDKPLKEPAKGAITFETNLPSLPKVEIPVEINIWRR